MTARTSPTAGAATRKYVLLALVALAALACFIHPSTLINHGTWLATASSDAGTAGSAATAAAASAASSAGRKKSSSSGKKGKSGSKKAKKAAAAAAAAAEAEEQEDDNALPAGATADPTPAGPQDMDEAQLLAATENAEKIGFKSQMDRLMDLLINSLYKSREIYIRELISNANDALDKIRQIGLTHKEELATKEDLKITVAFDERKKTITITDSGVGMTKADLINHLGTIAKSGTQEFVNAVNNQSLDDSSLIGQFGVGFYSSFLCASRVVVTSKNNHDDQHIWESSTVTDFVVVKDPRGNTLGRGTQITLHLKDDCHKYLNQFLLRNLILKYSQFINFPIYLWSSKTIWKRADEIEAERAAAQESGAAVVELPEEEYDEEDQERREENKEIKAQRYFWDLINTNKPIWMREPNSVSFDEYDEFYKGTFRDVDGISYQHHFKAEGDVDFRAILFVPDKAPNLEQSIPKKADGIRLYLKHVFITDELADFLPRYLSFIRGVIDSEDFPINVNRDQLQRSPMLRVVKRHVHAKVLDMFKSMTRDAEKFDAFFEKFGDYLKLGVLEDHKYRKKLMKLLRFKSSSSPKEYTTLDEYLTRMRRGQKQIFYATGPDQETMLLSPAVENMVDRGYEVLFFDRPVDEYLVQQMSTYNTKRLQNVGKDGVEYDDDEATKKSWEVVESEFKPLTEYLKDTLGEYVELVKMSRKLTSAPCAVLASYIGHSATMERIVKSQAIRASQEQHRHLQMRKVFELNPYHPVIKAMLERMNEGSKESAEEVKQAAYVLFEAMALSSGFDVRNPRLFTQEMEKVVRKSLGVGMGERSQAKVTQAEPEDPANLPVPTDDEGMGMAEALKDKQEREVDEEIAEYIDATNEPIMDHVEL